MDNAVVLIVLIVLIMALIAVLTTTKQQEAVEEKFMEWREKDFRVKHFLGDFKYNKNVKYPGLTTGNYANYCRMYANLDACRWSPEFRNGYCRDQCQEGKSMNCYYGKKYQKKKGSSRRSCHHKHMDNRERIDTCKSVLAENVYYNIDSGKLDVNHTQRQDQLNTGVEELIREQPRCQNAV